MQEMEHRRNYKYPPYFRLIQVMVSAAKYSDAISTSRTLAAVVQRRTRNWGQVVGPAPAVLPRINNMHRWQFFIRLNRQTDPVGSRTKKVLREILAPYLKKQGHDIHVSVDVDPIMLN